MKLLVSINVVILRQDTSQVLITDISFYIGLHGSMEVGGDEI